MPEILVIFFQLRLVFRIIYQLRFKRYLISMVICVVLPNLINRSMDFDELHKGINCDCIQNAKQNCIDYFARRVGVKENTTLIKQRYFRIHPDNYTLPFTSCKNACDERSLSIHIWNDETMDFLINKNPSLNPQYRQKLLIFKIKQAGGLVEHTPRDRDPYHYSLYMPDNTSPEICLEAISTTNINYDAV